MVLTSSQKQIIKDSLSVYQPLLVGVFGSYARNEASVNSDLDILIEVESKINLLDIIGLEQDLSEKLGIKVDLVTKRSLNKYIQKEIEKDLIRLL